jgi:hypothetical protein
MKSKIVAKNKSEFPCLKKSKGGGYVVLFTSKNAGTVVADPNQQKELGQCSHSWVDSDSNGTWEDFDGTVELSN